MYHYALTKDNKIRKKPFHSLETDTSKDYLECDKCQQYFEYELDDKGRITNISERYHGSY